MPAPPTHETRLRYRRGRAPASSLLLILLLGACTSSGEGTSAASPPASSSSIAEPTPSPTPTVPPKPKPAKAPLDGTYTVHATRIVSTIQGGPDRDTYKWRIEPRCAKPPCDSSLHSITGKYDLKVAYVHGKYRWVRQVKAEYTCGSTDIDAKNAFSLRVTKVKLVDGIWVAQKFTGTEDDTGNESGGCVPLVHERFALTGVRAG